MARSLIPSSRTLLLYLLCVARGRSAEERYLAKATDLADLERRMRVLERASAGPIFVTYNH